MPLPPQVPLVTYFSPNKADQGLIEIWSAEVANYQALDVGGRHPNSRDYPNFKLGKQSNLPTDHRFVIRTWVTDQTDPTWWNWAEKFSGDANAYPIFIRESREPRKTYAPLTKGQPLKKVYKLTLATVGSGYTVGTLPEITFSGGGGSGAAGHAVVAPDGTIAYLVLDDGGSGFTSSPTITIEDPPEGGTTATGTAVIQPATALLVAEEAQQFPDDSEFRGLYLHVVRVYETLPGPTIPYTRFDDNLGPVQGTRQAVLYANQTAALTATGKTTYEARDGSSIVAWKIVETWSTGEGTESNPAYPIGVTDFYDNERGAVHQTSQLTTDLTSPGSLTVSGGTATRIRYEPFPENPALRKKIIETWAVPGPVLRAEERYDKDLGKITGTRQLVENTGQTQTATATVQTRYDASSYGAALVWKIIESWSMPGPVQTFTEFEKDGVKKVVTRQLMAVGSVVTDETLVGGTLTREFSQPFNEFLAFQITETITVIDGDLLDLPSFTTSIPNLIPEIFRASIPTHIESHIEEGTAAETALATGEFEHTERQLTPLYKEVRSTVLDDIGSLPITITGMKETNAQKQVVTVAMKLCLDSTTPTVPTALIDVDFKKLGNGLAIEITRTIPAVFDPVVYQKQRGDSVPERFKKAAPEITERHATAGTATAPSLSSGDTAKSEQQRDAFVKETSVTNRTVPSGYQTLEGQEYDERLNILKPFTETVDPAGTNDGAAATQVTPLGEDIYGNDVELAKTYDETAIAAAFADFELIFPSTANLDLPDVLTALELTNEESIGSGDSSTPFFSGSWSGQGSYSVTPSATTEANQAVMPVLLPTIVPTYGNHKKTRRCVFLLPMPVSEADVLAKLSSMLGASVTAWPDFNPAPIHAKLVGRDVSLQVHAAYHIQDGGSGSGAEHGESFVRGYSTKAGMTITEKTISPTIHGAFFAGGPYTYSPTPISLTADAYYDSESQTVDAPTTGFAISGVGATDGDTTIPSTGIRLLRCDGEIYEHGHAMFHAEVFDFADL